MLCQKRGTIKKEKEGYIERQGSKSPEVSLVVILILLETHTHLEICAGGKAESEKSPGERVG